jgi:hypothetical protein
VTFGYGASLPSFAVAFGLAFAAGAVRRRGAPSRT